MRFLNILAASAACLAAGCGAKDGPASDAACAPLAEFRAEHVRIEAAQEVPGDGSWRFPKSIFNAPLGEKAISTQAFCRVAGVIEDEIRFEVWLPPEWNGRLQSVGNGGLAGAIPYPAMHEAVAQGYAAAGTDTGHRTPEDFFDLAWIDPAHPDRIENFGRRAHHLLAVNAKNIVERFYGEPARRAYFNGCSSGGWQGLTEAQQYPGDYDGVLAGAPANNFVRLQTRGFYMDAMLDEHGGEELTQADIDLLIGAALEACDPEDGVEDGIISLPESCSFDPRALVCKEGETEKCLSAAKAERARAYYGPRKSPGGLQLYPGNAYGVAPFSPARQGRSGHRENRAGRRKGVDAADVRR